MSRQAQGIIRRSSRRIEAAIATDADAGAYQALPVLRSLTISPPPFFVRSPMASTASRSIRSKTPMPFTVQRSGMGTMESPCAPSTMASTSCTAAPVASEMNQE